MRLLSQFANDRSAATAIEYALIASGVSIAIVTAVGTIGTSLNARFASVANALK